MIFLWYFLVSMGYLGSLHVAIRKRWRDRKISMKIYRKMKGVPPIAILKPLKGVDPGMGRNLQSFFELSYPNYSLHFCAESETDPALEFVRNLMRSFPFVKARIHIAPFFMSSIPNPKIRTILGAYETTKEELVVISDAGARVDHNYLDEIVAGFWDDDVAVVTNTVSTEGAMNFAAEVESVTLNAFYSRMRSVGFAIGRPTVMGLSMAFRRSVVAEFGGLMELGCYLAEDFMMGQKVRKMGYKILLIKKPVRQHLGVYSFARFFNRHLRWTRLRFVHSPLEFLFEPLLYSTVSAAIGVMAFPEVPVQAFFLVHFLLCLGSDLILVHASGGITRRTVPAWAFREAVAPLLWLWAVSGSTVNWRGNKLKLHMGGKIDQEL